MGELIAVLSGKGGTGKTSVCAGLSWALALQGKRVLCIDCDIGLQNLDIALGFEHAGGLSFLDVCSGAYSLEQAARHPENANLAFLTAPMTCSAAEVDPEAFCRMLQQARVQFDYIFMDAPAGVEAGFALTARYADRILLVTGSDPASIRDACRSGQLLEAMGKTNVRLIVNRITRKLGSRLHLTIDDIMDTVGLPLIGLIPEDTNVLLAAAKGKALLQYTKKGAAAACYRIAGRLQGMPRKIPVRKF